MFQCSKCVKCEISHKNIGYSLKIAIQKDKTLTESQLTFI